MDHLRISGTEPSSLILSQTCSLKSNDQKVPNQAKAKRDGVINPQNYNFNQHRKCWCSPNATNQPKPTVELDYMCPRGLTGQPAVTLTKIKSDLIGNMDHMRISGTEPSSLILSQTCSLKS